MQEEIYYVPDLEKLRQSNSSKLEFQILEVLQFPKQNIAYAITYHKYKSWDQQYKECGELYSWKHHFWHYSSFSFIDKIPQKILKQFKKLLHVDPKLCLKPDNAYLGEILKLYFKNEFEKKSRKTKTKIAELTQEIQDHQNTVDNLNLFCERVQDDIEREISALNDFLA